MRINYIIFFLLVLNTTFSQEKTKDFIVSKSGNAPFRSIQDALLAAPSNSDKPIRIFIKNGIYRELITIDASKKNIKLIGENRDSTILIFNNHAGTRLANGDTLNTWTCATVFIYGEGFSAKNISFRNDAGFTAGQAVAVRVEANRASFFDCSFIGNQDVLFLSGSGVKHYFDNCYIEGTTDFIFGAATAYFNKCKIHSKKNSHVTAASTNSIIPYGFVFNECMLTADSNINKVSLGRPWSPTASVTYINCTMGKHIVPEGWNNWKNPANEATARYAEYNSKGIGGITSARVSWAKVLSAKEAEQFTVEKVLGNWKPYLE